MIDSPLPIETYNKTPGDCPFMTDKLEQNGVKMKWLGQVPDSLNKLTILVPQFNEGSKSDFIVRLDYFKQVAFKYRELIDVVLIDDGSTDDSLQEIQEYLHLNPEAFFVSAVYPNANKVGAIYLTNESLRSEFVVLTDFDTDIVGFEGIVESLSVLRNDPKLMGGYFRMLPFEGQGKVFEIQQLEYALDRALYSIHQKDRSVPVMPGAGSCYKREVLSRIYREHSGLRNGEDREATLIGTKLGFDAVYFSDILIQTRPPLSFKSLVKQRIRWNLGYLETFWKEKKFYWIQMAKLKPLGIRIIMDVVKIVFLWLLPIGLLILILNSLKLFVESFVVIYLIYISWCMLLYFISPAESIEIKNKRNLSILIFPFFKIILDYIAWIIAFKSFLLQRKKNTHK